VLLLLVLAACDLRRMTCGGGGTSVDVDGDGRPDVRTVMLGERTVCREVDLDFDGAADVVRITDLDGTLQWLAHDLDRDGRVDHIERHEGGVLVDELIDSDIDGRLDLHRRYRDGKLVDESR
jgi:hypothetical protein